MEDEHLCLKEKCKSHQIPIPFFCKSTVAPPPPPSFTPSLSVFLLRLLFWLSASRVSPSPLNPRGPPLTPCYPHIYWAPLSPFLPPRASPPLPVLLCVLSPPTSSHPASPLCLCVREASKGWWERRRAAGGDGTREAEASTWFDFTSNRNVLVFFYLFILETSEKWDTENILQKAVKLVKTRPSR